MSDPYISVIVTAYNRKQYLPEALRSLESQTLSKDKFEVIVVKNFEDPRSDGIIRRNGWKEIIFSESLDIISMTILGIEESKGEVITFLDDDDLYAPERLAYVYITFKEIRDLVWFHNLQTIVDERGKPFPSSDPRAHWYVSAEPHFDILLRSDDKRWLWLIAKYAELHFNVSSTAVPHSVAESLRSLRGNSSDVPPLIIAGFSDGSLFHTARRLTYYRVHSKGSVTRPISPTHARISNVAGTLTLLSLLAKYGSLCRPNRTSRPFCLPLQYFNYQSLPASQRFGLSAKLLTHVLISYILWGPSLGSIKRVYKPIKDYVPGPLRRAFETLGYALA